MDSERRRLPGIVRRSTMAAAVRDGGIYKVPGPPAVETAQGSPRGNLRAAPMSGPTSRDARGGLEPWMRRLRNLVTSYGEAVFDHLRHNWTDALLAIGFLAVFLLSAYVLLKG